VIKVHSTPPFGGEIKLSAPSHKILWHVKKIPVEYDRDTSSKYKDISCQVCVSLLELPAATIED
jgi:hypothetical protein